MLRITLTEDAWQTLEVEAVRQTDVVYPERKSLTRLVNGILEREAERKGGR